MEVRLMIPRAGRGQISPGVSDVRGRLQQARPCLRRPEILLRDLDAQHALAPVAHHVERLRPPDRSCDGLAEPAALTGDDRSHLCLHCTSEARLGQVRRVPPVGPGAVHSTGPRRLRCSAAISGR
jgi:hypothetical protein